ncbi:MAG: hypothetical protein JWN94_1843 [Betaproteobacteria bacterium]|nr:hypothetical protein [Betaproteobacteria bacterium]
MQVSRQLPRKRQPDRWSCTPVAILLLIAAAQALAIDDRADVTLGRAPVEDDKTAYKFTPTVYRTTHEPLAYDFNLRGNLGPNTAWIGYYQRANEFQQLRVGYDHTVELPFGRVVPSVQYATRGFLGGSITAEIGKENFALLGFGRTNLCDYFNLNFDPNDMVLFGAGTRALRNTTLTVFQIMDDRLGTGQRVTHLAARIETGNRTRWTFDAFYKEGRSSDDGEWVHGTGATVTYDFGRYFARVASDPYVNFSRNHMVRASLGWRF